MSQHAKFSEWVRSGVLTATVVLGAVLPSGFSLAFAEEVFNGHKVLLDAQNKILPWSAPTEKAYDHFLRMRWNFIKTKVPNCPGPPPRSSYPQYYFYCAFRNKNGVLEPDPWMNDVGEKLPNWFESARLYYAYSGDASVMTIVKDLVAYSLEHGTSPSNFAWPNFPYTTTNAGDLDFRGFTSSGKLQLHEIQVDHAADIGLTYYRLYLFTGEKKFLAAALNVADTLAAKARMGDAAHSVWPYRVAMDTGKITAEYGANWTGAYLLLDGLIKAKLGNVRAYRNARAKARDFMARFPLQTGYWTDGHTDTDVNSNTYKSNMSASNFTLCLFDHPELDSHWKEDVPRLIKWTEDNFVYRTAPGEPATQWGANIVGEQDGFLVKMDYQTARYAAECARWYTVSGDESYREKAFRSLNWVTYCNKPDGEAFESPVSKDISNWWSDCYGECPRMFYHAFAGIPEWAPPRENHILYSEGVLKDVSYAESKVRYTPADAAGTEYLRLVFRPARITVGGVTLPRRRDLNAEGYTVRDLGHGDFAVTIRRARRGITLIE
ncbi:MAG: hypothetical protein ACE145_07400 [Terriglobia bacterium]